MHACMNTVSVQLTSTFGIMMRLGLGFWTRLPAGDMALG